MTPEQENKLLKEFLYCTKRSCNNCGKVNCENFQRQRIDCCGLWVSYKDYIKELEKENAELKETLKTYNGCGDWDNDFHACRVYLQHEELQMYIDQLTKATEIIKEFVCHYNNKTIYVNNVKPLLEQAEQFLKEIEK